MEMHRDRCDGSVVAMITYEGGFPIDWQHSLISRQNVRSPPETAIAMFTGLIPRIRPVALVHTDPLPDPHTGCRDSTRPAWVRRALRNTA